MDMFRTLKSALLELSLQKYFRYKDCKMPVLILESFIGNKNGKIENYWQRKSGDID